MQPIHIKASAKQLSKLRNGHKVRISKPSVEGEGLVLLVHAERFNPISRSFNHGKGIELALSPEEIQANKMEGGSLFGKKFDHVAKAVLGSKGKNEVYKRVGDVKSMSVGDIYERGKDLKERIDGAGLPTNVGGPIDRLAPHALKGYIEHSKLMDSLNDDLGTAYGVLSKANMGSMLAHSKSASLIKDHIAGRGFHKKKGIVGLGGNLVAHQTTLPHALMSQPFSANFQWQHTLPVQFQKYSKGGGLYA